MTLRSSALLFLVSLVGCSSTGDAPSSGAGGSGLTGGSSAGPGGAGPGGSGGGPGEPTMLAEAEVPFSLTVQGSDVLWTDVHWEDSERTAVVNRIAKTGGMVTRAAESAEMIDFIGIVAANDEVHFVGYGQTVPGGVFAVPGSGLDPVVVIADQGAPLAITRSADRLFWINLSPGAAMGSNGGEAITLAPDPQDSSTCVALAGSDLVWLSHNGTPRISRVAAGAALAVIVTEGSDGGAIDCLTADSEHVYFTRSGTWTDDFEPSYNHDGSVLRVPVGGGEPEVLATDQERPHGIALRGELVYWLNTDGALRRVSKAGGDVETLVPPGTAANAPRTQTVVADADGVYWISDRKVWALLDP